MSAPRRTASVARLALAACALTTLAHAQDLRLPAVLGDHMVLQRDTLVTLWGWSEPGAEVHVLPSWRDGHLRTRADADGRWSLAARTPGAGGPHRIVFESGADRIQLDDVLTGEVWLASGQSNMEWPLTATDDAEAAIAWADHPELRLFTVANTVSAAPRDDVSGRWKVCGPETVGAFSAVAYYFGKHVQAELGVPMGLVSSEWGGTPARAWTSRASLAARGDFDDALADVAVMAANADALRERYEAELQTWNARFDRSGPGADGGWARPDHDDSDWATMDVPGRWEDQGLAADGVVWFRRTFERLPEGFAGRDLEFSLGPLDDMDVTFWDGVEIGRHTSGSPWSTPRVYTVPGELVGDGPHVLSVRVLDTGGAGGFWGEPGDLWYRPVGGDRSETYTLAGAWRYRAGMSLRQVPPQPRLPNLGPHDPTSLFNGMIAPLAPLTLAGVLWYQGESDRERAWQYRSLFPQLILDWRRVFAQPELPFLFVQIAPFGYGGDTGQISELREAQRHALSLPNTGMAVTVDIGDPRDIHPTNKLDVGKRLAHWALNDTYGRDVPRCGPLFREALVEGREAMRVHFDHVDGELATLDGEPVRSFEIADAGGEWHAADVRLDGHSLLVSHPVVAAPTQVRYAWGATTSGNLCDGSGLPAAPFRSVDEPWITRD